jgi:hypothetical protein
MPRLTARAGALLAGTLVLAACGGGAATTAPTTAAAATQAPAMTLPPLPSGLGSFAIPSFNQDRELEGLLPDTLGGAPVTKLSMTGDTMLAAGGSPELAAVLQQFNKAPSDLSVAIGGTTSGTGVGLFAYRIKGVDANQFFQTFLTAAQAEDPGMTVTDMTLAGKAVKKVVTSDETLYLYASGDVLFAVGGENAPEALLTEALAALP